MLAKTRVAVELVATMERNQNKKSSWCYLPLAIRNTELRDDGSLDDGTPSAEAGAWRMLCLYQGFSFYSSYICCMVAEQSYEYPRSPSVDSLRSCDRKLCKDSNSLRINLYTQSLTSIRINRPCFA